MSFWNQLRDWLKDLFGPVTTTEEPTRSDDQPVSATTPVVQGLQPRVLLLVFDPIVHSEGGRKLTQVLGWHDVDLLCQQYIADLWECSGGLVDYQIAQRIVADAWPVKADGFRYDEAEFLRCWRGGGGWHHPDAVDYEALIADYDLLSWVEQGQIDEVWLFAFPYAGFYESLMVGPGAFWCNSPPLIKTQGISRRFVIMGFNYERDVGPMLESFGHRVESILKHVWKDHRGESNLWERFIRYDKIAPGDANCGWMHYAPNSQSDYDWGNRRYVASNCDDWLHFPHFQGTARMVNCSDWGNGDIRAHHKWWFERLPKAHGSTHGIANNWWEYAVDPNAAP